MRTITNLLTSVILAGWIAVIAIFSIQNITPISVNFLGFETIKIPIGLVLAFSVGIGALGGAILPILWQSTSRKRESYYSEDDDF